jgi:hypothetical protein
MNYRTFKIIMNNKDKVFRYDSATGTGTDTTTDPGILRDPNLYLAPRIDKAGIIQWLIIAILVVIVFSLYFNFFKQLNVSK